MDESLALRKRLARIAEDESLCLGGPWFMGRPDRWYEDATWRCRNDHVSKRYLRCEESPNARCLACMEPVFLTFPEDREGPLVVPTYG